MLRDHRLLSIIVSVPLLASSLILEQVLGVGVGHLVAGLALAVSSAPVVIESAKKIRKNFFNVDVLMLTAGVGAASISVFEEGAAVLILYNVAEKLEDYTVDKVRDAASRIARLIPRRAVVKAGGGLVEVPVESLKPGDVIIVKPGWRVPVDGRVRSGRTLVDQSMITGESTPVGKGPGDPVLSGVLNLAGDIEVVVEKEFEDSTVSRVVKLVLEAQKNKARTEKLIDRFSRYYTPVVIALAVVIATAPPLALGGSLYTWIYRSLTVLVIACPSAFVISTPVTMLLGLTRAMRGGVLVKGGRFFEELEKARLLVFDKTGTLTLGRLRVKSVKTFNGFNEEMVLYYAASAESKSTHPIAEAIVERAGELGVKYDVGFHVTEEPGAGVKAVSQDDTVVLVGSLGLLRSNGVDLSGLGEERVEAPGLTTVFVAVNGKLAGLITLEDRARPEAREVVQELRSKGYEVVMLTGDNHETAVRVARELGVNKVYAELLPEEKVEVARRLKSEYGVVVSVGDGVNDAPLLSVSNVGVAVGTAGNDVAIEAADVALMGTNLRGVPFLLELSRRVVKTLRANLALAMGLKLLMIALGALGLIPLWVAVLGDDGVTLLVIANSLLALFRFKPA